MSSPPRLGMGPSDKCILEFHRTFRWLPSSAGGHPFAKRRTLTVSDPVGALFLVRAFAERSGGSLEFRNHPRSLVRHILPGHTGDADANRDGGRVEAIEVQRFRRPLYRRVVVLREPPPALRSPGPYHSPPLRAWASCDRELPKAAHQSPV